MKNLSIRTQLWLLVVALLVLLVATNGVLVDGLRHSNATLEGLYNDRVVPLKQLKEVADAYAVSIVDTAHKGRDGAVTHEAAIASISAARERIARTWGAFTKTRLVPREAELIAKAAVPMQRADAASQRLVELFRAGNVDALRRYTGQEMYPEIEPVAEIMDQLITLQQEVAQEEYQAFQAYFAQLRILCIVAVLGAIVFGLVYAWRLIGAIVRHLREAMHMAQCVAANDLTARVTGESQSETGKLLAALSVMSAKLGGIVTQVRMSSDSIATGASQIAMGNSDLSQRTEEQASSLQNTAASMEELTQTVRTNSDNATKATHIAQDAAGIAQEGEQAMQEVVRTMQTISASSKQIGDIVSVIDAIAFQTNILALNAAVEAARAGEQGRGFAVVASEVRNLAQRSATAAKEIRGLIADSIKRVQDGAQHVDGAGQTMGRLIGRVREVAELMSHISTASSEQASGIANIGTAIQQLDQVTQQNAALVEQAAAAAASLSQQAIQLASLVAQFKLAEDAGDAAGALAYRASPAHAGSRPSAQDASRLAIAA
jgi:methyl-accepting chemotaxis protein